MRPEKATIVADVQKTLKDSPFVIVADFSGMQVKHFEELRARLDTAGAKIQVVKNTFIKRAAEELGLPNLNDSLTGQTALVTGENDICAAAKILKTFASEFERPTLKAGILDNDLLTADEVRALADLPSKEVLQSTLLGLLLAPATRFVRVLNEPGASLARLLQAKADKDGAAS